METPTTKEDFLERSLRAEQMALDAMHAFEMEQPDREFEAHFQMQRANMYATLYAGTEPSFVLSKEIVAQTERAFTEQMFQQKQERREAPQEIPDPSQKKSLNTVTTKEIEFDEVEIGQEVLSGSGQWRKVEGKSEGYLLLPEGAVAHTTSNGLYEVREL